MTQATQITWRNVEPSAALEERIRKLAQSLEKFSSRIIHCHAIVQLPHKKGRQAHIYEVHVQLTMPGTQLIAQHEHSELRSHADPYVAVRDAFRAVRRQLRDHQRRRRQGVKAQVRVPNNEHSTEDEPDQIPMPMSTASHPGA